jgi:hypothetical protein
MDIWGEDTMKESVHLFLLYSRFPVTKFSHHGFITYIITCFSVNQPATVGGHGVANTGFAPLQLRRAIGVHSPYIFAPLVRKTTGLRGEFGLESTRPDRRDSIVRAIL